MKRKGIIILAFLLLLLSVFMLRKTPVSDLTETMSVSNGSTEGNMVSDGETSTTETMMEESESNVDFTEGDGGDEGADLFMDKALEVPEERRTRSGFQEFLLTYSNTQNYTPDGLNFGYADVIYPDGIDMDDSAARISGMGNAGYLVWVLRNTFGRCSEEYLTPGMVYKNSTKVDLKDLAVGDLGLLSEEGDICGVCVGLEDGEPVFSIMDGTWSAEFPFGSNRLCYLQDGKNEYIGESPPVAFRHFCRPDLPWMEDDTEPIDLKGRIPHGKQN